MHGLLHPTYKNNAQECEYEGGLYCFLKNIQIHSIYLLFKVTKTVTVNLTPVQYCCYIVLKGNLRIECKYAQCSMA